MVATVATVAYLGLEARAVEGQVQLSPGLPAFIIGGLPDKAVAESRERVRAALSAIGLALPRKRITGGSDWSGVTGGGRSRIQFLRGSS
jgi:magnesium chelatase family protein